METTKSHDSQTGKAWPESGAVPPPVEPGETARASSSSAGEQLGAMWDDAKETARSTLGEQKDVAADSLGNVAGALRDAAQRSKGDGSGNALAGLTGSAADGLERLSGTLRHQDVATILRDVESFAREQPLAFFGLAVAAGFLGVRFIKASNA
ncbi:MAG: hypothetical protein M3Y55_02600 [Pseudomonadota bacterium]|nr:hypothetical protein [Pseudomonadota bacterium]